MTTYNNQAKTPVIGTNTYNSSYAYNASSVAYNGVVTFASYTNQTKNSSSYSNQSKTSSTYSNQSKN